MKSKKSKKNWKVKINWNYIKSCLLIGLVFFLFAFAKKRNNDRSLSRIDLRFTNSNNLFITENAVNKLLIQNEVSPKSVGKDALDLVKVETLLENNAMIENAEVFVTIDGKLGAEITQRKPVARIMEERPFYLDRQGEKMPLSKHYSARVPLVSGVTEDQLNEVIPLVTHIRKDEFLKKHITALHRMEDGRYTVHFRELDFVVYLGKITEIKSKFKNFKAFYQHALLAGKLDDYKKVDLQFGDQVVCTKI